jgi:hypothetical protein
MKPQLPLATRILPLARFKPDQLFVGKISHAWAACRVIVT